MSSAQTRRDLQGSNNLHDDPNSRNCNSTARQLHAGVTNHTENGRHSAADREPKISPPAKKAKYSDFTSVVKRSYSWTETQDFKMPKSSTKIIHDSIHGHMQMPPVAMDVIDTPQFQRLRSIKQLGSCHWVYPSATHNRFQHSLGVGFLAKKFAQQLKDQRPDLVTEKDVHCVMLAGLCHDLGHGPFSHLWEGFVKKVNTNDDWHHEDSSIMMFDRILDENKLREKFLLDYGLDCNDILFVKEMVAGPIDEKTGLPLRGETGSQWLYRGRGEEKSFLYEIVANKMSGVDVDKWDYFLRDDYNLKIGHVFNYERFMYYSKIITTGSPSRRHICLRDKEAEMLREMFQDRARLHRFGYQHRVTRLIDEMLIDAFTLADNFVLTKGEDGKQLRLSLCHKDQVAYEKLTDSVFDRILDSDCQEAITVLKRIQKRDLYRVVATIRKPGDMVKKSNKDIHSEICNHILCDGVQKDNLFVSRRVVTQGMGAEKVSFYYVGADGEPKVSDPLSMDFNLPDLVLDKTIWVCSKNSDENFLKSATEAVHKWNKTNDIPIEFGN